MELTEVYRKALDKWGIDAQVLMLAEEAAELSVAAAKLLRHHDLESVQRLAEEIADVQIMIEQMCVASDNLGAMIEEWKLGKIARLKKRLEGRG